MNTYKLKVRKSNKKYSKPLVSIILIIILFVGIGFAYIQSSLSINGNTTIAKGVWDVHFENLAVSSESAIPISPATISEDKRNISFSFRFNNRSDFYEFEVDVVNNGELDAMVSDIELNVLSGELEKLIEYKLSYDDDSAINDSDALKINTKERIKLRLYLKENLDLRNVSEDDKIDLTLTIPYVQADENIRNRDKAIITNLLGQEKYAYLDTVRSPFVSGTNGIDFGSSSSATNGQGFYVRTGTENDEYPIFYYRGAVTNNNVLFANYCWKIIRTTETGGTKLLYNGSPVDGKCTNTTEPDTQIATSYFNSKTNSLADVGYMYGTRYEYEIMDDFDTSRYVVGNQYVSKESNYYFSKNWTYNNNTKRYSLTNATQLGTFSTSKSQYPGYYTCLSSSATATCSTLYYILGSDSSSVFYISLTNGQNLEQADVLNMKLGTSISCDTNTKKCSLSGTITTINKKTEWYAADRQIFKDKYMCSDFTSTTCNAIHTESDTQMLYIKSIGSVFLSIDAIYVDPVYFGNDVSYDSATGMYSLVDYHVRRGIGNKDDAKYHYFCLGVDTKCSTVYYAYYINSSRGPMYYITLTNGKTIESAIDDMFKNENDSVVKKTIEDWYALNIENDAKSLHYDQYLEDTVWCNNRTITSYNGWSKDSSNTSRTMYFFKENDLIKSVPLKDAEACPNVRDRFTVSTSNGNGKSKQKVGLITISEALLAGHTKSDSSSTGKVISSYLNNLHDTWTLSPYYASESKDYLYILTGSSYLGSKSSNLESGVRPVVSLKHGVVASSGDGTANNPYVVG